ncbi:MULTISPECIES: hypothetical protein [unclassified Glutamicibacter]|uniref:hypothetical protein n=1 Tax=unclassified Glutamicibacter TaxID=2627139 RepID=UPI0037FBC9CC
MTSQGTTAKPDEYWVYRLRDASPSERVLINSVDCTKSKPKLLVTFDDGRQETVPGNRIRVPWADVAAYDRLQEAWSRIRREDSLDDVERDCINQVFDLLVPTEVAELGWRPVNDTTNVKDQEIFSTMLGLDLGKYAEHYSSVHVDGALVLSPLASAAIAERICGINPTPILDVVFKEEEESWLKCKYGSQKKPILDIDDGWRSPEEEYDWYLKYDRPRHELLRQWCGYRAMTSHERMKAAEAETHRLELLLEETFKRLEPHMPQLEVDLLRINSNKERITPYNVRPRPDRPLSPSEIPERIVYRTRRQWW